MISYCGMSTILKTACFPAFQNQNQKMSDPTCSICSQLADEHWASQKYGWPENDSYLPAATGKLNVVKDFQPDSDRALQLQRCPECGQCYLYQSDYEYLVNGSEDEQHLTRLSATEAEKWLQK